MDRLAGGTDGRARVLVVGLGNAMRRDDAAGLLVVRRLLEEGLPEGVRATEAAGGGAALLDRLGECEGLVVVDAVDAGRPPGSGVEHDLSEVRSASAGPLSGGHVLDVGEALALAGAAGLPRPVRVRVVGIQAADAVTFSAECSPAVGAAIGPACERVRRLIVDMSAEMAAETARGGSPVS